MPDIKKFPLTTSEQIFKPIHELASWAFGDPKSQTFETRRTFLETLAGIFGFIIISKLVKSFED